MRQETYSSVQLRSPCSNTGGVLTKSSTSSDGEAARAIWTCADSYDSGHGCCADEGYGCQLNATICDHREAACHSSRQGRLTCSSSLCVLAARAGPQSVCDATNMLSAAHHFPRALLSGLQDEAALQLVVANGASKFELSNSTSKIPFSQRQASLDIESPATSGPQGNSLKSVFSPSMKAVSLRILNPRCGSLQA